MRCDAGSIATSGSYLREVSATNLYSRSSEIVDIAAGSFVTEKEGAITEDDPVRVCFLQRSHHDTVRWHVAAAVYGPWIVVVHGSLVRSLETRNTTDSSFQSL